MVIWIIILAMTAAAVMAVLWPLSRHRIVAVPEDSSTRFYRDQLAEIERDASRGLILAAEADAARAEAGRRLLKNRDGGKSAPYAFGEPALRRRRAVSALALSVVPIVALAIYGVQGSPHATERAPQPVAAQQPSNDLAAAVSQIEAHLAKSPDDGRGWDVLAPVYVRAGRLEDAVKAYSAALKLLGRDATRLTNYAEALVLSKGGVVTSEAKALFQEALATSANAPKARFYLARAAEQDGQVGMARAEYSSLLSNAPADAGWTSLVRDQIARLDATRQAPPDAAAINGMVEGLAARLEKQGGSAEEWARLVRSYVVLGDRHKAVAAMARARQALAADGRGLQVVEAMASDLKLTGASE
jgi:cytochrome c-type biogenesis protein CcmH